MQKEGLKLETDIKFERPEDILKTDKNEIIVKLEKGEGTLKIEKIGVKKEVKLPEAVGQIKSETDLPLKQEKNEVELTLVKTGIKSECEAFVAEDEFESTVAAVKKTSSVEEMETGEEKAESGADTSQETGTEDKGDDSTELKEIAKESSIENGDDESIVEVHCESLERQEFLEEEQKVDEEDSQNERKPETDSNSKDIFEKLEEMTEDKMEVYTNKEPDETIETEKSIEEDKCDNSEVIKDEVERTNEKGLEEDSKETGREESIALEMSETRESAEASSVEEKNRMRSCESDIVSENSLKGEESLDAVPHTTKQQTNCNTNSQAAELKAMFPDLEVIQPLSRLAEVDPYVLGGKQPIHSSGEILDYSEPTVAQLLAQSYQNPIKWPKVRSVTVF
jgi:chromodomain-helicase-DNA-binding protein 7